MHNVRQEDMTYKAPEDIAERLKRYRMARLWTLQQMANAVGMTAAAIWKIETGSVTPQDLTIAKMRRAFPDLFDSTAA
jgi:transcriptional regulator with XRE-family HTH domain